MKPKRYKYAKVFKGLFKFAGFRISGVEDSEEEVHIYLAHTRKTGICPNCGKRCALLSENYQRTIRDLDISFKKCYIEFHEHRLQCRCGFHGYERFDFVRPSS